MSDSKLKVDKKKVDPKEFDLPETVFIRDIENKVFQSIVFQCVMQIEGISLTQGNYINQLLGRSSEGVSGIVAEQDDKQQSVNIKLDVNVVYGVSIPEKAEEIQTSIAQAITLLTGLHVACVHVVFKNVISKEEAVKHHEENQQQHPQRATGSNLTEEYADDF